MMSTALQLILITFSLLSLAWVKVLTNESRVTQPAARAFTITRRVYQRLDSGLVVEEGTQVEYRDSKGNVRYETKHLNELLTNKIVISGRDDDVGWYAVGQREQEGLYIKTCP